MNSNCSGAFFGDVYEGHDIAKLRRMCLPFIAWTVASRRPGILQWWSAIHLHCRSPKS